MSHARRSSLSALLLALLFALAAPASAQQLDARATFIPLPAPEASQSMQGFVAPVAPGTASLPAIAAGAAASSRSSSSAACADSDFIAQADFDTALLLDQDNAGVNVRLGQSFTVPCDGVLESFEFVINQVITPGEIVPRLYVGDGESGTLLTMGAVQASSPGVAVTTFTTPYPVATGEVFTFTLESGAGGEFGILGSSMDLYAGGTEYDTITGTFQANPSRDLVFAVGLGAPPPSGDDAGDIVNTPAADATGQETISGLVDALEDEDCFAIDILDAPAFSATVDSFDPDGDSQLFLFDDALALVAQNDDANGLLSAIPAGSVSSSGDYFLCITAFNNDPTLSGNVLTGWSVGGDLSAPSTYSISLTGVTGGGTGGDQVVTQLGDSGAGGCTAAGTGDGCTLREAIAAAGDGDTVTFAAGLSGTIALNGSFLRIDSDLTLVGPGPDAVAVSGGNTERVFEIGENTTVAISGLTVRDGAADRGAGILALGTSLALSDLVIRDNTASGNTPFVGGGGLFVASGSIVTLTDSEVFANASTNFSGGGILNFGTLTVERSTVRDNTTSLGGAGVNNEGGALTISQSTISGNVAQDGGGGISNFGGTLTLSASTLSGNAAGSRGGGGLLNNGPATLANVTVTENASTGGAGIDVEGFDALAISNSAVVGNVGDDVTGAFASGGFNVVGAGSGTADFTATGDVSGVTAPVLGALADNGGPTLTHAPLDGSLAVDLGGTCGPEDQRGLTAPADGDDDGTAACDAGSVEAGEVAPVPDYDLTAVNVVPTGSPIVVAAGGSITFDYTVANNTAASAMGSLWFTARNPAGNVVAQARIVRGTLAPMAMVEGTYEQAVPASAPQTTYSYTLSIGIFPTTAVDSEAFTVEVTAPARAGGAEAWAVTAAPWAETGEGLSAASTVPTAFALAAAYPNPFAERATLGVDVPEATDVHLAVYDVLGRRVAVLLDGPVEAGRHEAVLDGAGLPSGTYLVRLTADTGFAQTQRITLVR